MAVGCYGLWLLFLIFAVITCGAEAMSDPTVTFSSNGGGMALFFLMLTGAPVWVAIAEGLMEDEW